MPWVGMIVVFPDHTHLHFQYQRNLTYFTEVLLDISD